MKFNKMDAKRFPGAGSDRGQDVERDLELSLEMGLTVRTRIEPMAVTPTSDLRIAKTDGKGHKSVGKQL
jgi:hypothetical protein